MHQSATKTRSEVPTKTSAQHSGNYVSVVRQYITALLAKTKSSVSIPNSNRTHKRKAQPFRFLKKKILQQFKIYLLLLYSWTPHVQSVIILKAYFVTSQIEKASISVKKPALYYLVRACFLANSSQFVLDLLLQAFSGINVANFSTKLQHSDRRSNQQLDSDPPLVWTPLHRAPATPSKQTIPPN